MQRFLKSASNTNRRKMIAFAHGTHQYGKKRYISQLKNASLLIIYKSLIFLLYFL